LLSKDVGRNRGDQIEQDTGRRAVGSAGDLSDPATADRVMTTNVRAPWLMCRTAASVLIEQGYGRVINLAIALEPV
jgi:NAD(P)-dependent dehydrogenase (short-subunit alcohol dehydrogenase family)